MPRPAGPNTPPMQAFAALLDRLVLTPPRNTKLRLLRDYFRDTPDPDRGYALAALTGELDLPSVKPAMLRALVTARVDELLFWYSADYVGDFAQAIALIWPAKATALGTASAEAGVEGPAAAEARDRQATFDFPDVAEKNDSSLHGAELLRAGAPRLSEVVERLLAASRLHGPRLIDRK